MEYEDGFYIYTPNAESEERIYELSWHMVIEILEDDIYLHGHTQAFTIDYVNSVGTIGKMVMTQEGVLL